MSEDRAMGFTASDYGDDGWQPGYPDSWADYPAAWLVDRDCPPKGQPVYRCGHCGHVGDLDPERPTVCPCGQVVSYPAGWFDGA